MSNRNDSILSYIFALGSFMRIEQQISWTKVSLSEFISGFETEWNCSAHLSQCSVAGPSTYRKLVKDLFGCQEAKRDLPLAWFAESHDNVGDNLLSKDHLTYHEAKERILNLRSNHPSPSRATSKNSKRQHKAIDVSSSNGKKDKKKMKVLDCGGYCLTLLYIADSHFTFHNFLILYTMHVLDSGGILYFCLCIPTVLTM
jgi:hypothetical protein